MRGKKVGLWVKFTPDMDESIVKQKLFEDLLKVKGFYLFGFDFKTGHEGMDFINNIKTAVLTARAYKKPRFIKPKYKQ